jgi:hypothetical protein
MLCQLCKYFYRVEGDELRDNFSEVLNAIPPCFKILMSGRTALGT